MIKLGSQIAKFMGPTWGLPGSCRPQMGPMLAPWTLLSEISCVYGTGSQGVKVFLQSYHRWKCICKHMYTVHGWIISSPQILWNMISYPLKKLANHKRWQMTFLWAFNRNIPNGLPQLSIQWLISLRFLKWGNMRLQNHSLSSRMFQGLWEWQKWMDYKLNFNTMTPGIYFNVIFLKFIYFHSSKCVCSYHLQNVGHIVLASLSHCHYY